MFKFGIQPRIQWTLTGRVTRHSDHSALIPDEQDHAGAILLRRYPQGYGSIQWRCYWSSSLRVEGAWSIGFCVLAVLFSNMCRG
jgi:hypothetical protein